MVSDSASTVRIMMHIKEGSSDVWAHGDFWAFTRTRRELVGQIKWIRSHQTREEALAHGLAEVDWGGTQEADTLAGQGIRAHGAATEFLSVGDAKLSLARKVHIYLVQRALECSVAPWYLQ